jgi:pimeloyl-ACP methyl ester carboxylesterase
MDYWNGDVGNPRPRHIGVALALALAAAVAGCGVEVTEVEKRPPRDSVGRAELHRCGAIPRIPGFRCGEIEVPFEREDASLGTTRIGFAVRAPDNRRRPPRAPIFAVEGGPGYASTLTANAYVKLFGSLLRRHPLVLVDMRGTGRSQPVDCPDVQGGRGPESIVLAECARRLGRKFESYRTSAAADDIDDVRRALGYERIVLYGDSYGTYLGQSYAYRHPDRLDALVLDSAYPARGETAWYPSLPRTGIRSLEVACRRSPKCRGDAKHLLARLTRHLRQTNRGVGPLIDALVDAAYGPPQTYLDIVDAGRELLDGDPGAWRRLTDPGKPGNRHIRDYARAGELVVSCNDYPMLWQRSSSEPQRRAELEERIRDQEPDVFEPFTAREVALSSEIGYLYCLTWPKRTDLYEPPVDKDAEPTEAPVLVVSGELDSVTTPHEGRRVAEEFPNATYYEARNAGHVASLYNRHSPAAVEIRRFLRRYSDPRS